MTKVEFRFPRANVWHQAVERTFRIDVKHLLVNFCGEHAEREERLTVHNRTSAPVERHLTWHRLRQAHKTHRRLARLLHRWYLTLEAPLGSFLTFFHYPSSLTCK